MRRMGSCRIGCCFCLTNVLGARWHRSAAEDSRHLWDGLRWLGIWLRVRRWRCDRRHFSHGGPFELLLSSLTFCPQIPALALLEWVLVKVPTATLRSLRIRRYETIVFWAT